MGILTRLVGEKTRPWCSGLGLRDLKWLKVFGVLEGLVEGRVILLSENPVKTDTEISFERAESGVWGCG